MKNLSLKTKLILLSVKLVGVIAIVGGVNYWGLSTVVKDYKKVTDVSTPQMLTLQEISNNLSSARAVAAELVSDKTSEEVKKNAVSFLTKSLEQDGVLDKRYSAIEFADGQEQLYKSFRENIESVNKGLKEILTIYQKENKEQADIDEMNNVLYGVISEEALKVYGNLDTLLDFHRKLSMAAQNEAAHTSTMTNSLVGILSLSLTLVALVTSYMFSASLTKSLIGISASLDKSSTDLSSAATQIASSSDRLSRAATEQAASLEQTSAAVDEMNSMIGISAENSRRASDFSSSSQQEAEKGRQVVNEMVNVMNQINTSNDNIMKQIHVTTDQMEEIVNVIKEIETKTKVINDIVFQTKLLSFNASVEAARAGEQGKGFAVVAEEVGNLASMSGNAANEIAEMLSTSVNKVTTIVDETKSKVAVLIKDGQEKLRRGADVAKECDVALTNITSNINEVTRMGAEISNATVEQSKGIEEITKAMGQLDRVTQSNSATSTETAGAADTLASQARELKAQVNSLITILHGGSSSLGQGSIHKTTSPVKKIDKPKETKVEARADIKLDKKIEKKEEAKLSKAETKTGLFSKPEKKNDFLQSSLKKEPVVATKASPTPVPTTKKVVEAPTKTEVKDRVASTSTHQERKVIGSGKDAIPSYDHPGFEDV